PHTATCFHGPAPPSSYPLPLHDALPIFVLATGFRPALEILGSAIRRDTRGFAMRADRVSSADHEALFFVGHNYDSRGGLLNIAADRKSTRLNSSHVKISYAVFCLKKKST